MKIGIEAQRLYRKKKHGMDIVALELIKNLQLIDRINEYVVFINKDSDTECVPYASNFKIVVIKNGFYPFWEQIVLPKAVKKEKCDILHCTSNTGPIFCKTPIITTLHDVIFIDKFKSILKGGTWYQIFGNIYRRFIVPILVKKSMKVVTVSYFEKQQIENKLKLGDKLTFIYNGISDIFFKNINKNESQIIRRKYHLPEQFLVYIGNTDPKKNTLNVLKAFSILKERLNYKLIIIDFDKRKLIKLLKKINHIGLIDNIILIGYVSNNEMPFILNNAKVFLYPSLRESFGLPILEAMACGIPVITSNTSSMPEIANDAALIINPHNPIEIADGMKLLLTDFNYYKTLSEKGLLRAKEFSWKIMAERYLDLYLRVYMETKKQ